MKRADSLRVERLRHQRDRLAGVVLEQRDALRAIAALPCPYDAEGHETCDGVPQQFITPDACPVCTARRALKVPGGAPGSAEVESDHLTSASFAGPTSEGDGDAVPDAPRVSVPDFCGFMSLPPLREITS